MRHNLFLIEDCAHVLISEVDGKPLGSFGDASVFSLRKFFPLYDGGELVLNHPRAKPRIDWDAQGYMSSLKAAKESFDQIVDQPRHWIVRFLDDLVQSVKGPVLGILKSSRNAELLKVEKTDASFDLRLVNRPMSRVSRMIFAHSDAAFIAARRRANYSRLQNGLAGTDGLHFLIKELPEGVCPWVFPIFFSGKADACTALRREGIPAVTWDGVRPADLPWERYPDADFLYKNLVFLPVHQSLTAENLDEIVRAVKEVLQIRECATAQAFPA